MTARTSFSVLLCLLTIRAAFSLQSQPTRSFSRREWLSNMATTAVTATTILPQAANADPSVVSGLQGGIQDKVAPGHWIGQFIGLNSKTEKWEFPNSTPEEVSKALVDVLTSLTEDRKAKLYMPEFEIQTADASKLHVLTWTKLEWLDTLDVTFRPKENNGCTATASFYATGFLPTNIPGAPLFNVAFFWFPFASPGPRGEMLQSFRLRALNGLVTKRLEENKVTPDLYFP
ncbi:unnamed protein product [Pseudo-nitzschia multistriata]|uniref:Uncharacterized protein n=1 Tax=Pseudo-nitzschia multistriata TaxID=183589 RepID=A0A448Z9B2_9STRA|nr:unnamed protein product [Pseudo-nitzschia multistriata]